MTQRAILLTATAWSEWGGFTARDGAMAKIAASAAKQKRIIEKTRRSAVGLEDCVFIGWFLVRAGRCWLGDSLPDRILAQFSLTKFLSQKQSFSQANALAFSTDLVRNSRET